MPELWTASDRGSRRDQSESKVLLIRSSAARTGVVSYEQIVAEGMARDPASVPTNAILTGRALARSRLEVRNAFRNQLRRFVVMFELCGQLTRLLPRPPNKVYARRPQRC